MECQGCGREILFKSNYCPNCGRELSGLNKMQEQASTKSGSLDNIATLDYDSPDGKKLQSERVSEQGYTTPQFGGTSYEPYSSRMEAYGMRRPEYGAGVYNQRTYKSPYDYQRNIYGMNYPPAGASRWSGNNPGQRVSSTDKIGFFVIYIIFMFIPVAILIHSFIFWNSSEVQLLVLLKGGFEAGDGIRLWEGILIGLDFFTGLAFLADLYVWKSKHPGVAFGFFSFFLLLSVSIHGLLCWSVREDDEQGQVLLVILIIVTLVMLILTIRGCYLVSKLKQNGAFPSKVTEYYY